MQRILHWIGGEGLGEVSALCGKHLQRAEPGLSCELNETSFKEFWAAVDRAQPRAILRALPAETRFPRLSGD